MHRGSYIVLENDFLSLSVKFNVLLHLLLKQHTRRWISHCHTFPSPTLCQWSSHTYLNCSSCINCSSCQRMSISEARWVNLLSIAYALGVLKAKTSTLYTYHSCLFLDFLNPQFLEKSLEVYLPLLTKCDSVKFKTYSLVPTITVITYYMANQEWVRPSLFFRNNREFCVCLCVCLCLCV